MGVVLLISAIPMSVAADRAAAREWVEQFDANLGGQRQPTRSNDQFPWGPVGTITAVGGIAMLVGGLAGWYVGRTNLRREDQREIDELDAEIARLDALIEDEGREGPGRR